MFHRQGKTVSKKASPLHLTAMIVPHVLLATDKRQTLVEHIRVSSGLASSLFDTLCLSLIYKSLDYYQSLPETSTNYYSAPGGLFTHALNRTEAAMQIFRQHLVPPDSSVSKEQQCWLYALFSASLLQGIGKLQLDYEIHLFDKKRQPIEPWNPLLSALSAVEGFYHHEFRAPGDDSLRRHLNLILAYQLMPKEGFAWIASNPEVLATWLSLLHEDLSAAGILGAILERADAIAIQRDLMESLALHEPLAPKRANRVGTFIDPKPDARVKTDELIGAEFIKWLNQSLENKTLTLNKVPQLVLTPTGLAVYPELFHLFMREHPLYKNWQAIQKGVLSLRLHADPIHQKQAMDGLLLTKYSVALPERMSVYDAGSGKTTVMTAVDVILKQLQQHSTARVTLKPGSVAENTIQPPTSGLFHRG